MCVSAGTITKVEHGSRGEPEKRGIFDLFSRDEPTVSLHDHRWRGRDNLVLDFTAVTQAFVVYPERPELISSSTLLKLEGTCGDGDRFWGEDWMLVMPYSKGAGSEEMLRLLIGERVPLAKSF
jgi:CCR4-NOT transcriptional complex subunit CAF120